MSAKTDWALGDIKSEVTRLEAELAAAVDTVALLNTTAHGLEGENAELKAKLAATGGLAAEYEAVSIKLAQANTRIVALEAEIKALKAQLPEPPPPPPPVEPKFQIWDSTAGGFLVAQGLPRLKCPSEGQFFPGTARGEPDWAFLRDTVAPRMRQFDPLVVDVEAWMWSKAPEDPAPVNATETEWYRRMIQTIQDANPGQRVGLYSGWPERYAGGATVGAGAMRDKRIADWAVRNAIMQPLADQCYAGFPSLYGLYSEMPTWVTFARQNVEQARILAKGKPVIGYLWPTWHSNAAKAGYPISATDWTVMLETCYEVCDGVAIWMPSTASFNATAPYWKATEAFMVKYKLHGR